MPEKFLKKGKNFQKISRNLKKQKQKLKNNFEN